MKRQSKTLLSLFFPIALETLFHMLAGMVDTLMLSSVSDEAVGAVGTANTYISMFIIMFSVISSGMIAVMTQNIGAGRPGVAYQARQLGAAFNAIVGTLLALFMLRFSDAILETVGVAPSLMAHAKSYLQIVGGCCFLNALVPIFSNYLRSFGHTRAPMLAALSANLLNVVLNALFLFPLNMGVRGVAIATALSRLVNLSIVMFASHRLIHAKNHPERLRNREVFGQIIRIGLPSALETALYNGSITLIIRFLNQMDASGMNVTARSYAMQLTNISYCLASALAQANAIMTGWRIGAGQFDACDRQTKRAALVGIFIAVCIESAFALSANSVMRLFTDDPAMIALVGRLLAIDIVLEIGRAGNLVFGQALKTSGDALFTTIIAAVFMYLCAAGGTYLLGVRLGWMAVGSYIALACDECIRAVCMFLRWQSGKWRKKQLVHGSAVETRF
ncbi:MAG: MATE family efflux transporter [Clostridia bacterium]|nr:MATE family efflux transporter [Clostridia bacterium]